MEKKAEVKAALRLQTSLRGECLQSGPGVWNFAPAGVVLRVTALGPASVEKGADWILNLAGDTADPLYKFVWKGRFALMSEVGSIGVWNVVLTPSVPMKIRFAAPAGRRHDGSVNLDAYFKFTAKDEFLLPDLTKPRLDGDFPVTVSAGGQSVTYYVSAELLKCKCGPDSELRGLLDSGSQNWSHLFANVGEFQELLLHIYPTQRRLYHWSVGVLLCLAVRLGLSGLRRWAVAFVLSRPNTPLNWRLRVLDEAGATEGLCRIATDPAHEAELHDLCKMGFAFALKVNIGELRFLSPRPEIADVAEIDFENQDETGKKIGLVCRDGEVLYVCKDLMCEASTVIAAAGVGDEIQLGESKAVLTVVLRLLYEYQVPAATLLHDGLVVPLLEGLKALGMAREKGLLEAELVKVDWGSALALAVDALGWAVHLDLVCLHAHLVSVLANSIRRCQALHAYESLDMDTKMDIMEESIAAQADSLVQSTVDNRFDAYNA